MDPNTKMKTNQAASLTDVYEELNTLFSHDFKCKKVTKNAAFTIPDVNVPQTGEYLKVN